MIRKVELPDPIRVGILQFIPQLEDAVWGFIGALEAALGFRPEFEVLEARGCEDRCPGLARSLVGKGCGLLFGCLTPAAQRGGGGGGGGDGGDNGVTVYTAFCKSHGRLYQMDIKQQQRRGVAA